MSVVVHSYSRNPSQGRVDGEQVLLKCSGCDKPLVYVWANQPNLDVDFKVRADCCYCEDKSFPIDVHGGFSVRGYDKPLDCPENVRAIVDIVNIGYNQDEVLIETEKVR